MSEVLELSHLSKDDGVAEVDVGGGWVEAELYAELPGCLAGLVKFFRELLLGKDFYRASPEQFKLLCQGLAHTDLALS